MSAAEGMGIPRGKRRVWTALHVEAWALVSEGNALPHAKKRDVDGTYYVGTPALRRRYRALRRKFEAAGFQPPLQNGHGWFYGGGVWF